MNGWAKMLGRANPPPPPPALALDRRSAEPLRRQIYLRVREAIATGTLRPGDRLPSARTLANQLGVARGTVDAAYATLAGEGYLVTRGAAGTAVAAGLQPRLIAPTRRAVTPRELPTTDPRAGSVQPFQMGLPAMDAFPRKLWTRLAAREARQLPVAAMGYPDPFGHPPLREQILRYLAIARGIECAPEALFITSGFQGALGLLTRVLLDPGDTVCVEDPGYFQAARSLSAAGARLVAVPVDGEGLDVAAAVERAPQARLVLVTPSHQMPLGVSLSLRRRMALLDWARSAGAWIIEDDYDSEFRYTGPPLPALKSLDRDGCVLYVGTFSKVLFPALRLGYLVVPERLVPAFRKVCGTLHPDRPMLVEAVVAEFMGQGHFYRHIRRMRALYARRRAALAAALRDAFADRFEIELQSGGMHLLARPDPREDDLALVRAARSRGLAPGAVTQMAVDRSIAPGLLLGFTNVPADQAPGQVRRLRKAFVGR